MAKKKAKVAKTKVATKPKSMTKTELVREVASSCDLSQKAAGEVVDQVFGLMRNRLIKDGTFAIQAFGTFNVKDRAARKGRNPQTGDEIDIPARKVVGFSASSVLKADVNG